jgi:glycosyltransferase involved in cell wall biosynthesis
MKILYLITGLRLGGAEKQLLLLAREMKLAGNTVLVAAMESNGVMAQDFLESGIEVEGLDVTGIRSIPAAYKKLKRLANSFLPDVIHAHMIHANFLAGFFKLFNQNTKVVCTAHNVLEGSRLMMSGYHFVKKVVDWSTNVSQEAFDHFIKKKYFSPHTSSFIPNATDTTVFDPTNYKKKLIRRDLGIDEQAFVFFSAGRLHYQKNYPDLLKAFSMACAEVPNAVLYIAGEGHDLGKLLVLSAELNLSNRVVFLGRRNDIPALMAMSDCFVLSSKFEGFGLVVAEAMAMQIPVISTDCGGVKEVMGGIGTLVNNGDVAGLAKAMVAVSRTGSLCYCNSRKHIADNYGIPVIIDKWKQLYNNL